MESAICLVADDIDRLSTSIIDLRLHEARITGVPVRNSKYGRILRHFGDKILCGKIGVKKVLVISVVREKSACWGDTIYSAVSLSKFQIYFYFLFYSWSANIANVGGSDITSKYSSSNPLKRSGVLTLHSDVLLLSTYSRVVKKNAMESRVSP